MKKLRSFLTVSLDIAAVQNVKHFLMWKLPLFLIVILASLSISAFTLFYLNHLGLSYNDARSHLDIGRRVVEGLKPGFSQLGSVWLPLPHLLMVPTIWSDFMWHTGLSGAIQSMVSYVATSLLIYAILRKLGVFFLGRIVGVAIFALNMNVLYLQSTAMTELLLLATMTAGFYQLIRWSESEELIHLIWAAFWIMLSTLNRYDGWFLFLSGIAIIAILFFKKKGFRSVDGGIVLFATLAGFGIFLWFLWNQLIFKDALYFAFGPYSARTQQAQLESAGVLHTKGNLTLSLHIYLYAMIYNTGVVPFLIAVFGGFLFFLDKRIHYSLRIASLSLLAPFVFNVTALFLGHSVLFVQGISGNTWFNVRYGIFMLPSLAIFAGYLIKRANAFVGILIGLLVFSMSFAFLSRDAVTIDDARFGASGKNVREVSGWLARNVSGGEEGFVLISVASHDAIVFSSGLPMSRFIHEGTGSYWEQATVEPDRWARWIIMRTNDNNDLTFKLIKNRIGLRRYRLVHKYPFADIYELRPEYLSNLQTKPVFYGHR